MSRRMSCSMTMDAVRERRKTVTRRHVDTWKTLKAGDRLTLIEKGMGLAKGQQQVVLAEVEVVSVRVESLFAGMTRDEVIAEGFPHLTPTEFCFMWAQSHKQGDQPMFSIQCRRIEWRYLA